MISPLPQPTAPRGRLVRVAHAPEVRELYDAMTTAEFDYLAKDDLIGEREMIFSWRVMAAQTLAALEKARADGLAAVRLPPDQFEVCRYAAQRWESSRRAVFRGA